MGRVIRIGEARIPIFSAHVGSPPFCPRPFPHGPTGTPARHARGADARCGVAVSRMQQGGGRFTEASPQTTRAGAMMRIFGMWGRLGGCLRCLRHITLITMD